MAYLTLDQLKSYIKDDTLRDSDSLQDALDAAQQAINEACDRYFTQDAAVSARFFNPQNWYACAVDDISTTTGLLVAVDTGYDGTYAQSWTLNTDYFTEPLNPSASGITKPIRALHATLSNTYFPQLYYPYQRPTVKVTAKWGWAAVPPAISQATKVLAAELYKLADAPLGVAGYGEYGQIRVRENPKVRALIQPYMINPYVVA